MWLAPGCGSWDVHIYVHEALEIQNGTGGGKRTKRRKAGQGPTVLELPPLAWNSEESKKFMFELGLPSCYEGGFVKMGRQKNILFNSLLA